MLNELSAAKAVVAASMARTVAVASSSNCDALIREVELVLAMAVELKAALAAMGGRGETAP